jgi:hypothetical protein
MNNQLRQEPADGSFRGVRKIVLFLLLLLLLVASCSLIVGNIFISKEVSPSPSPTPVTLTLIKVICPAYSDVPANRDPGNADATGGHWAELKTSYQTTLVDPATDIPTNCVRTPEWGFNLNPGGTYSTGSGGSVDVALNSTLLAAAQAGSGDGGIQVVEVVDNVRGTFGALRCYRNILNGDNLDTVYGLQAGDTHIYCIAYNVAIPGSTPTPTPAQSGSIATPTYSATPTPTPTSTSTPTPTPIATPTYRATPTPARSGPIATPTYRATPTPARSGPIATPTYRATPTPTPTPTPKPTPTPTPTPTAAPTAFSISAAPVYLFLGQSTVIVLTLSNPNAAPIYVTALTVGLPADSTPGGCAIAANITLVQSNLSAAAPLLVPAHGQATLSSAPAAPQITLIDLSTVNQDVCKNKSFNLSFSGNAHS